MRVREYVGQSIDGCEVYYNFVQELYEVIDQDGESFYYGSMTTALNSYNPENYDYQDNK